MLKSFRFETNSMNPLPSVVFEFSPVPANTELYERLKPTYEKFLSWVRSYVPWAKWSSPYGSSAPETAVAGFDPGDIKP